jgi:hypothetical protein
LARGDYRGVIYAASQRNGIRISTVKIAEIFFV